MIQAKDLQPVISWLRNGCDPIEAARELELLVKKASFPHERVPSVPSRALEALRRATDTAMQQALVARIPECGKFGEVAQDLDYALSVIDAGTLAPAVKDSLTAGSAEPSEPFP